MSARPALWGEGLGNDPSYPAPSESVRYTEIIGSPVFYVHFEDSV